MGIELHWVATLFTVTQMLAFDAAGAERMQWALHFYDWEPTVRQTQEIAVARADYGRDEVDSMRARARWSSLLPTSIEGRWSVDGSDSDRFTTREDLDSALEVMDTQTSTARTLDRGGKWYAGARWDLRGLVFAEAEVDIARLSAQRAEDRMDLEGRIAQLYAERRQVQVDLLLDPPLDAVAGARRYLLLKHIGAQLDALTGGWFTVEVARRRRLAEGKNDERQ